MERFTDVTQDRVLHWRTYNLEGATVRHEDDDLRQLIDASGMEMTEPAELDGSGVPITPEGCLLLDRRDREHVCYYQDPADGSWKPTALKRDDDLMLFDCIPFRVIGPARGRVAFMAYYNPWFNDDRIPMEAAWVTDRAPVDTGETPMPIIPEPPPPPEGMMAKATAATLEAPAPKLAIRPPRSADREELLRDALAQLPAENAQAVVLAMLGHGTLSFAVAPKPLPKHEHHHHGHHHHGKRK